MKIIIFTLILSFALFGPYQVLKAMPAIGPNCEMEGEIKSAVYAEEYIAREEREGPVPPGSPEYPERYDLKVLVEEVNYQDTQGDSNSGSYEETPCKNRYEPGSVIEVYISMDDIKEESDLVAGNKISGTVSSLHGSYFSEYEIEGNKRRIPVISWIIERMRAIYYSIFDQQGR